MKIQVIISTTRPTRFGEKPAQWIMEEAKKRKELEVEILDLRDYPLPFFDDPVSPSYITDGNYANEVARKLAKKIAEADGYIIVTAEYNHGYPAVLKNSMDYIYKEWNKKPIGFVGYGSVGGARAIEQLRLVAVELEMTPIRIGIHIPGYVYMAVKNQKHGDNTNPYESLQARVKMFLDELIWWTKALKQAREEK